MWLVLAVAIVALGLIFGEHVNLFWLIGIIISVIYCWGKHNELKVQVRKPTSTNSDDTGWIQQINGAVVQMSGNFWEIQGNYASENILVFNILKDSYAEHLESALVAKLPANSNFNNRMRIISVIQWCKNATSMTELCEVFLIVGDFDYMGLSGGAKRDVVKQINAALLKNRIPESLINNIHEGRGAYV